MFHKLAKLNAHCKNLAKPKVAAFINIEGTDDSMLGIINRNNLDKNFIGTKVKAILGPHDKREGTIKDILHYDEI